LGPDEGFESPARLVCKCGSNVHTCTSYRKTLVPEISSNIVLGVSFRQTMSTRNCNAVSSYNSQPKSTNNQKSMANSKQTRPPHRSSPLWKPTVPYKYQQTVASQCKFALSDPESQRTNSKAQSSTLILYSGTGHVFPF
jgi:hypothetical protein